VATKKERIKTMSEQLEPVAPTVGFVTRAGDSSGRTADHAAWIRDLEERKARSAAFEAKRQEHKPQEPKVELSAIDAAIDAADHALTDFEETHLKPNLPLIEARNEVERLRRELSAAEKKQAAIEEQGDSVQRLANGVRSTESQLQSLVSRAEAEEISRLAEKHYGWAIPHSKISAEMKREFALHASVLVFKRFYVQRSVALPNLTPSVGMLQAQLQFVGEKLVALREHLETCVKTSNNAK